MKMGDRVSVYPHDRPDSAALGIVIAARGDFIAVTLLPDERQLCAHRKGNSEPWINVETGEPVEIV